MQLHILLILLVPLLLPLLFFCLFISEDTAQGQTKRGKKYSYSLLLAAREWSKGRSISVAEVSWYSPHEGIQVIDRRKYRGRKAVPVSTSGKEERITVEVQPCKRGLDSIGVSLRGKTSMARPWEEGRQRMTKEQGVRGGGGREGGGRWGSRAEEESGGSIKLAC